MQQHNSKRIGILTSSILALILSTPVIADDEDTSDAERLTLVDHQENRAERREDRQENRADRREGGRDRGDGNSQRSQRSGRGDGNSQRSQRDGGRRVARNR